MRTVKAQVGLCIHTVWPGLLLSANRIIGYYRMYEWRAKAQMILYTYAGWSESAHSAHVWRHYHLMWPIYELSLSVALIHKHWMLKFRCWQNFISPTYLTSTVMIHETQLPQASDRQNIQNQADLNWSWCLWLLGSSGLLVFVYFAGLMSVEDVQYSKHLWVKMVKKILRQCHYYRI